MTTAYITHKRYAHHTMSGHPEHAGRLKAIWSKLDGAGLGDRMLVRQPKPLPEDVILAVHTPAHLDRLGQVEAMSDSQLFMLNADTYMTPESYTIARLAAGGVCLAVEAVMDGEADNGLAVVRPPGHHATQDTPMGFCLLNNVAIAARYAQHTHGIDRVLIVDYDVHHGNGTQDIFYDDERVLFVSSHQSPLYPGTGMIDEIGQGAGEGYTINIPLRAGTGDAGLRAVYDEVVWAAAERFQPELILVSAGFDAHWQDPLAGLRLSLDGFAHLTREIMRMADRLCDGRVVFALEGGYNLEAVGTGVANVARCLLGDDAIDDPLGPPKASSEPDVSNIIARVKDIHGL